MSRQALALILLLCLALPAQQAKNAERTIRELLELQNQAIMAQFVKMAEKLEKAENTEKNTKDLLEKQNQAIMDRLVQIVSNKLQTMDQTSGSVVTQVQENANPIKNVRCRLLLQRGDVVKTKLFSVAGKKYYLNGTALTWYGARDWCAERGMQLPSLKTLTQLEAVRNELNNRRLYYYRFWLFANDIGHTPGQFKWTDGSSVDNTTWNTLIQEPNSFGAGKDTCVFFNTASATLLDSPCTNTLFFMCEVPSALSSCL